MAASEHAIGTFRAGSEAKSYLSRWVSTQNFDDRGRYAEDGSKTSVHPVLGPSAGTMRRRILARPRIPDSALSFQDSRLQTASREGWELALKPLLPTNCWVDSRRFRLEFGLELRFADFENAWTNAGAGSTLRDSTQHSPKNRSAR